MKKNLLIVIDNLGIGGGQNMVCELVKNIDSTQYSVSVLCYGVKRNSAIEEQLEALCKVEHMNVIGRITPIYMWKVLRKISALKPDILHAHLGGITFALPWARIHRKPIVITAHTKPEKAFSSRNEKQLRSGLKKKFVKLVAVSQENFLACKDYFGIGDDKCFCINNGIDVNKFYSEEHSSFSFINVARQDENKNQALLIRCFAKIHAKYSDTRLILVGDGPCHLDLIKLAKDLGVGDFVEFPGLISNVEEYYARSDVYVQSSFREAMPLSVLEAMAAKLPLISTDVGGLKDVVKDNGILVEVGNEEAFYNAMKELYEIEESARVQYGMESAKLVKKYSAENMTIEYCKLFDSLIWS